MRAAAVNWKTTVGGVMAAAGAVMLDHSNDNIAFAGKLILAVGTFFLGSMARDSNKSTEQTKGK